MDNNIKLKPRTSLHFTGDSLPSLVLDDNIFIIKEERRQPVKKINVLELNKPEDKNQLF